MRLFPVRIRGIERNGQLIEQLREAWNPFTPTQNNTKGRTPGGTARPSPAQNVPKVVNIAPTNSSASCRDMAPAQTSIQQTSIQWPRLPVTGWCSGQKDGWRVGRPRHPRRRGALDEEPSQGQLDIQDAR